MGRLTGTLASGNRVDNLFFHNGYIGSGCYPSSSRDGIIAPVEGPQLPTPSPYSQLALIATMMAPGMWAWRRQLRRA